jgi:plasmid stabilization system protein ParE
MNVEFSGPAFAQLGKILSDLISKNPTAAERLAARIDNAVLRIGQFPEAYQLIETRPGIRCIPLLPYPYLMFYRVMSSQILIVAIAHGAREEPWDRL